VPEADVFAVLAADHDRIFALAGRLTGGAGVPRDKPKERKGIVDELVMELSRHEVVEEMLFWPVVRDRADGGPDMCEVALQQEWVGKRMLNELTHTSPGNEDFDTHTHSLAGHLREHITYEQNIVWPRLRLALSEAEAQELGEQVKQAKRRAPSRPHPHIPADPALLTKIAPVAAVLDSVRNAVIRHP
jgi:hypothetical protein